MPLLLRLAKANFNQRTGRRRGRPQARRRQPTGSSRTGSTSRRRCSPAAPGSSGPPFAKGESIPRSRRFGGDQESRTSRRSCRSPTSASRSRTARRTRSSSSPASTPARRSPAPRLHRPHRQLDVLARHHRRRRHRHRAEHAAAGSRRLVEIPLPRHRRKGRRHRLRRQRLERGDLALGVRHRRQPEGSRSRCCADRCSAIAASTGSAKRFTSRPSCGTNTPDGIRLLPRHGGVRHRPRQPEPVVDERTVRVNDWSSAEWTMTLPADGSLGSYSLRAILESDRPKPKTPEQQRPGASPSRARRVGRLGEVDPRLLSRRRLPPARLPRRCDAGRRAASPAIRCRAR